MLNIYRVVFGACCIALSESAPRRLLLNNFDLNPLRRSSEIVHVSNGDLQGTRDSTSEAFFGVPYALPPVGSNRFMLAQSIKDLRWSGVRPARKTGNMCLQRSGFFAFTPVVGSEDCLYLNVYRPFGASADSNLPVLVFIPGGAFSFGSSYWMDQYDGSQLAFERQAIVVVPNYRLGLLGFFASAQLQEANGGTVGNLGLQDQREALRWVKREIRNFGGNPDKVLLFGESAGGFSVIWHSVSRVSARERLFHSVIAQSATADLSWFFQSKDDAFELYAAFASYLGCPAHVSGQLACLQAIPESYFLDAWVKWSEDVLADPNPLSEHHPRAVSILHLLCSFGPVVDAHEEGLLDMPIELIKAGDFHKVPLVAGITRSEGTLFSIVIPQIVSKSVHESFTTDQWIEIGELIVQSPDAIKEFFKLYPIKRIEGLIQASRWAAEVTRDLIFGCSTEELVTEWANHAPAWMYLFSGTLGPVGKLLGVGSMHSFDLFYVFKSFPSGMGYLVSERDVRIASEMGSRWVNMAIEGSPNPKAERIHWPEFKDGGFVLEFGHEDVQPHLPESYIGTALRAAKNYITPPSVATSRLFYRPEADLETWPAANKCEFWYRQRPLPWIIHVDQEKAAARPQYAAPTTLSCEESLKRMYEGLDEASIIHACSTH